MGVKIPHNANKISHLGKEINERDVKPGDLVLFGSKTADKHRAYHIGIIYESINGQIKVIHATSKGVNISNNFDSYWKSRVMSFVNIVDAQPSNELSQTNQH